MPTVCTELYKMEGGSTVKMQQSTSLQSKKKGQVIQKVVTVGADGKSRNTVY